MPSHAQELLPDWTSSRRRAGRMLVALDFDGTLSPIAPSPDEARMVDGGRRILERLAARPDTDVAIVSGRALEDVRARVGLPGLFYSGNHGMELEGPGIEQVFAGAARLRPAIAACAAELREGLAGIDGVLVEDKGLGLSIHFRQVRDAAAEEEVRSRVDACCAARPGLRILPAKKALEVRPDVPWDKARAIRFLMEALDAGDGALVPVLFVGDDEADEAAFRALAPRVSGVLVAGAPAPDTAAVAWVRGPEEVAALLAALADAR